MNVCCATLLSSELVGPSCVQERSSNPRGRACRPSGKGSGEAGILSDVVPVFFLFYFFYKIVHIVQNNEKIHDTIKNKGNMQ